MATFSFPGLNTAWFDHVGRYEGEGGVAAELRRVGEGFVWEFRPPPDRRGHEIAVIGDGSFVLLSDNPQVHWHKIASSRVGAGALEAVYQSDWFEEFQVVLRFGPAGEAEYGKLLRGERRVWHRLRRVAGGE
jgi:hypothetical protein